MANWLNQLQSLLGQQGRSSSSASRQAAKFTLPGALGGLAGLLVASKSSQAVGEIWHQRAAGGGGAVAGSVLWNKYQQKMRASARRHRLMSRPHRRHLPHRPISTPAANG
jgi:uncharacterized membrane protein YebE (DUF533 family)